jgi:selenide,water dikinase
MSETPRPSLTAAAGRPGDVLVLTKPLGLGIAEAARSAGADPPGLLAAADAAGATANAPALEAAVEAGGRCAAPVDGAGLLGCLRALADASGVGAALRIDRIPVLDGALAAIAAGHVPEAAERNRDEIGPFVDFDDQVTEEARTILFDPQSGGGLLLAIPAARLLDLMMALAAKGVRATAIGQLQAEPIGRVGVLSPVTRIGASGGGSRTARRAQAPEGGAPPAPPEPGA